jgi:glyoxylase-like metal-dependent hydrolase (beta-lactamase superfamily II)
MYVEQLYTGCLAEAAYYIESNGEAAIIDPMRETEPYLEILAKRGAKLKYVLETHFHADFVSGHLDLAKDQQPAQVIPAISLRMVSALNWGKLKSKYCILPGTPWSPLLFY